MNLFSRISSRIRRWPSGEISVLAVIFVVAAALFGFVRIADEVGEGDTHKLDTGVLLAFRNPAVLGDPIGPPWLKLAVRDLTSLGSPAVLAFITFSVIGFMLMDGKRAAALFVLAAIGGGTVMSGLLKFGFNRTRPDLVAHLVDVQTSSFPSGHAMLSAVTYLTLGTLLARVQPRRAIKAYLITLAVVSTLLIGISRIYLGVHWPTDVLAGWCAGAAWAMLCWLAAYWLQRRGRMES